MDRNLKNDLEQIEVLLDKVKESSIKTLHNLDQISTYAKELQSDPLLELEQWGIGGEHTLDEFLQRFYQGMVSSAGSSYFGFVTGGTTPAALMGDWLVSTFDQNATARDHASAGRIEEEALHLMKQLLKIPKEFSGSFVTGATMSNFVGLAIGRQWVGDQLGINIALEGLYAIPPIKVISATPHSSVLKAMSMLGLGRKQMHYIPTMKDREAIDVNLLEEYLKQVHPEPCIVVVNAGTVNTVDFDDIKKISELKSKYNFYMHVDGAFGGFASCSPRYEHFMDGLKEADSITVDAHKWLNVPYDSAVQFTKHPKLQVQVFQNNGAYLGELSDHPDYVHITPENSRRLRALPAWFTLKAYGQRGYQEIVERNCTLAQLLGEKMSNVDYFKVLSITRLNVVCFTIMVGTFEGSLQEIKEFLKLVNIDGRAFFTPTIYQGTPAIRAAVSNWRTEEKDINLALKVLKEAYKKFRRE